MGLLPFSVLFRLKRLMRGGKKIPRKVDFGDLRRLTPVSPDWGFDRGLPIDRYYLEGFLEAHSPDIRGRVLEIGGDAYARRFGAGGVSGIDVLNLRGGLPGTTIVADISNAPHIASDTFDCIIFTQTLQLIYELRAAVSTLHRILKPGGVLLATFPGISKTSDDLWGDSWCWCFTPNSAKRLFSEAFGEVEIKAYGNVLAAVSFLHGLAREELTKEELDAYEPGFEVSIAVRASK